MFQNNFINREDRGRTGYTYLMTFIQVLSLKALNEIYLFSKMCIHSLQSSLKVYSGMGLLCKGLQQICVPCKAEKLFVLSLANQYTLNQIERTNQ